jgi:putative hemolysin
MARPQCDTPLVSNLLSKMCMQQGIRRQIFQKSRGRISACHMPDISSCNSRTPAHMKCGRAVENTGIFSQDAASSAGEAQAQPMLFFKYTRSIGWLPKLWWRSTGNVKMPMVNGPGHESIWIRQIADTCAFEYLNIGSYIHYEVIMCLAKPISYREFV